MLPAEIVILSGSELYSHFYYSQKIVYIFNKNRYILIMYFGNIRDGQKPQKEKRARLVNMKQWILEKKGQLRLFN